VSIPASGSTTILVWYGNPSATSAENVSAVFLFFDHFNTSTETLTFYGSCTWVRDTANSVIKVTGGSSDCVAVANVGTPNVRILTRAMIGTANTPFGLSARVQDVNNRLYLYSRADVNHLSIAKAVGGSFSEIAYASFAENTNTWYIFEGLLYGTNLRVTVYDNACQQIATVSATVSDFSTLTQHGLFSTPGAASSFDYLIIAQYVSPEPSTSVSATEKQGGLFVPDVVRVKVQYFDTGATSYYSIPIVINLGQDQTYNVSASLDISGVNPSYGANITVELLSKVILTDMSYNNSSVSYTYLGQNASNSRVYNVYNFTTTANGTLIVNGTYANRAWNTVVKIDRKVEAIPVLTAVLGESVEIVLPARGNVTLPDNTVLVNVTSLSFNTRTFGTGNKSLSLLVNAPESDDYGLLTIYINTVYASRTVTVLDKDGRSTNNVSIIAYNIDANKVTPANAIEAGNNSIQIFFRDIKLAETLVFYVNHTNVSDSLTVSVFSKLLPTDYKNANKRIYAQKDFNLTILDAKVSRFAINLTEPCYVYVDLARNFSIPQLILNNCSLISYAFPYAKLYCSGNATVAEGYTITLQVKDVLGRAIDVVFALDNESQSSSGGIATIIKPVGNYNLTLPAESVGFKLKTNATYSITLENDTSITVVYKVPARIESREVRVEKKLPLPFPFPFIPFETQEVSNVARVNLEGSVMDYFGAPVPNRNVIIEIRTVGGAVRYANTTTDSSGNFRTQTDFTTNTTYMITYILPEDDTYVGASSVKTLTYEAIAPPPAPSPIGITIPTTVIVAVIALVVIIAIVAVARSVRKKTVKHMLEDMSDFEFFRRVK
jgi:hypothetical protein